MKVEISRLGFCSRSLWMGIIKVLYVAKVFLIPDVMLSYKLYHSPPFLVLLNLNQKRSSFVTDSFSLSIRDDEAASFEMLNQKFDQFWLNSWLNFLQGLRSKKGLKRSFSCWKDRWMVIWRRRNLRTSKPRERTLLMCTSREKIILFVGCQRLWRSW